MFPKLSDTKNKNVDDIKNSNKNEIKVNENDVKIKEKPVSLFKQRLNQKNNKM